MAALAAVVLLVRFTGWWGLVVVLGLVVSIVLHEFGHYLTAKQAGMKVTEFFVGFGPKLFSFTRGETTYGVKPFPLGAYVRIIGMNDMEDVEPGDVGRTYREKGYWARLRVVLAGPFTNLAIALLLLLVAFGVFAQPSAKDWSVKSVVAGTAAAQAGLRKGDLLVSVNGEPVGDFSHTFADTIQRHAGHPVTLVVVRDGKQITMHPTVGWQLDATGPRPWRPSRGVTRWWPSGPRRSRTTPRPGLPWPAAPKGTTRVTFDRNGYTYATTVATPVTLPAHGSDGFLGIGAGSRFERLGPWQTVTTSVTTFGSIVKGSVTSLGHFFSPSSLSSYTHYVLTNQVPATSGSSNANPAPIVAVSKKRRPRRRPARRRPCPRRPTTG